MFFFSVWFPASRSWLRVPDGFEGDINPLVGTSGRVSDEVRNRLVEGLDRVIDVIMKSKKGVNS